MVIYFLRLQNRIEFLSSQFDVLCVCKNIKICNYDQKSRLFFDLGIVFVYYLSYKS